LEKEISAFISITTEHMQPEEIQQIIYDKIKPSELYFVTGDYDYIMRVTVDAMEKLRELIL
jgi:DNA-binding Lrp family transcriptional regulator